MLDQYNREINYLRISVTDRCNLRCVYCMPAEGVSLMRHEDILSFDEIAEITRYAVKLGIKKVRLTGGEPLVRKGITELVSMLSGIKGIEDLSMTTNGILLDKYAKSLKEAGLHRVNISLDSLDQKKYASITRIGNLNDALRGVDAALQTGLIPVKINCVIDKSPNEPDAKSVAEYCKKKNIQLRYIYKMDLEHGHFNGVIGGDGGKCSLCNRLRLSADGKIKPCLFSELEYNVRESGIQKSLEMALANKPKCGTLNKTGHFYNIGG